MHQLEDILKTLNLHESAEMDIPFFSHLHSFAIYTTHELGIFEAIEKHAPINMDKLMQIANLEKRPLDVLLIICMNIKLIEKHSDNTYLLTPKAKIFLLKSSQLYIGSILALLSQNEALFNLKAFQKVISTNSSTIFADDQKQFDSISKNSDAAKLFTHAMRAKSLMQSFYWIKKIDLSNVSCFLDIGGGSGTDSIAAANKFKNLTAIVYDLPFICEIAQSYISEANCEDRVKTQVGDMWSGIYPAADCHFYSSILHDWPIEKCKILLQNSFQNLVQGNRIIIHELLLDDDKSGPVDVVDYNALIFIASDGQQFSGMELILLLKETGFVKLEIIKTGYSNFHLITGIKP